MIFLSPLPVLENDIVRLEPLKESDFERLFQVASDPEIWEQHPSKDRYKREIFEPFFQSAIASNTSYLIIDRIENKVMGTTRFYEFQPDDKSIAIGYTFIAKSYWGTSYNSSVKKMMLATAFKEVEKVYFHVGVENIRSQKAVMKLGAKFFKIDDFISAGKKLKYHFYTLEKKDFYS